RAGRQPESREGARPRGAAAARTARRRGNRVNRRPTVSLPGLTRQSILLRKKMDARVKPAHDEPRGDTFQMERRAFISLLGAAAAAWPLAARAQSAGRMRRVGIVMPYPKGDAEYESRARALRQELAKLGWIEGSNVQFDERWTTDDMSRVRADAASLMASNPDVVVATGGRVVPVLMQLSRSIPIVVPGVSDPVGVGWVQSLARPGGNVTGFTFLELSIFGKMLETLKQ